MLSCLSNKFIFSFIEESSGKKSFHLQLFYLHLFIFHPLNNFYFPLKNQVVTIYLLRCTQQGETRNTQTRINLKLTVFNVDEARQGRADTQEHQGVTSRPENTKLNRQELIYTRQLQNTAGQELTNNHTRRGQETNQIRTQEGNAWHTWLTISKNQVVTIYPM